MRWGMSHIVHALSRCSALLQCWGRSPVTSLRVRGPEEQAGLMDAVARGFAEVHEVELAGGAR